MTKTQKIITDLPEKIITDLPKKPQKYFSVQVYNGSTDLRMLALPIKETDTFKDVLLAFFEKRKRCQSLGKIIFSPDELDPSDVVTYIGKTSTFSATGALEAQFDDPVWPLMEIDDYKYIKYNIKTKDISPISHIPRSDYVTKNAQNRISPIHMRSSDEYGHRTAKSRYSAIDQRKRYQPKLVFDPVGRIQYALMDCMAACWDKIKDRPVIIRLRMLVSNIFGPGTSSGASRSRKKEEEERRILKNN